ncbi:MAG: acyl-CoA dehydrogenase [Desulfatitalea sp. BRH_c12]|nr:MAG: acyl-CoA dehydrogenase [Desulfatitalea sp. BRH_c12]
MAQQIADRRDIDFVLYEQLDTEKLAKEKAFDGLDRKAFDMIITEARNFAVKELLPVYVDSDRIGVTLENGKVKVPESFHRPFKLLVEGEWTSMCEAPELGGQGLPHIIDRAVREYLSGACGALVAYAQMGHGTGKMIELYGTAEQKKLFINKLYDGIWGGTMVLTESNAGSDVGALTTSAHKNADGTYTITGDKIFITNGEHDLTENIIHPVLARVEGAPAGVRGISIFIVPKIWVNPDGTLGQPNDVVCTGIEEKTGIHGSATCSLAFGSKGQCRGLLLGQEGMGMKIMFKMMNEARQDVGFQGLFAASRAYLYAVNYARERRQGKELGSPKDAPAQVPIIRHPDVRRMLMWMKCYVEGLRSLIYYVESLFDRAHCSDDPAVKKACNDEAELLTPIIKSMGSDRGFDICVQAIQVYGGYGYIKEYPVEQLMRDTKIASLYEGTNGIQAMDLLGRKLGLNNGQVFMNMLGQMHAIIEKAKASEGLQAVATEFKTAVDRLGEVAMIMGTRAMSAEFKTAFAHASPFLNATGDVIMAWMLLWRAQVAATKLAKGAATKDGAFYKGQIKSAEFFINTILPVTLGSMNAIAKGSPAAIEIDEDAFGG